MWQAVVVLFLAVRLSLGLEQLRQDTMQREKLQACQNAKCRIALQSLGRSLVVVASY